MGLGVTMTRARALVGVAVVLALSGFLPTMRLAEAGVAQVLILDSTVTGGAASPEGVAASDLGFGVDVVDATEWAAMSTADFASYEGIILGDPTCSGTGAFQPAIDNVDVWSPAINGNVILVGTDPVYHLSGGVNGDGGATLTQQGVAFALDGAGDTGLYLTLSCIGGDDAGNELLSGLGTFDLEGTSCDDDIHIVATHPALTGLTDGDLADWGCSTHEGFTVWPEDTFQVLALAIVDLDPVYTADDGTQGNPYILASGEGLEPIRAVNLTPAAQTLGVGQSCVVTASVQLASAPVADGDVIIEVTVGPHAGVTGTVTTNAAGEATFSYVGSTQGVDTLVASYDNNGNVLTSNEATCTFGPPSVLPLAPPAVAAAASPTFTG